MDRERERNKIKRQTKHQSNARGRDGAKIKNAQKEA